MDPGGASGGASVRCEVPGIRRGFPGFRRVVGEVVGGCSLGFSSPSTAIGGGGLPGTRGSRGLRSFSQFVWIRFIGGDRASLAENGVSLRVSPVLEVRGTS